jgi:RNA polymerase sigma-70 factor (ECF subfamily)
LARSRALDYLRSKPGRAQKREQELDETVERQVETAEPDNAAYMRELREGVTAALGQLDSARREAIELAFYEGCSHSEIADRLRLPLGTVKTRIRTGMQQLRQSLAAYRGNF